MNILIVADHWAVASGRYVLDALKRLGHDARSTGCEHGAAIWGGTVDEKYIWTPDRPEQGWLPDLVIIMDSSISFGIDSAYTIEQVKAWGDCPVVVYGVDNHVRTYAQLDADRFFLAHGHGYRIGEPNVEWLPCGYDPVWFTPGPPLADREHDAALMGVLYQARGELLYVLAGVPGLKVQFGTGAVYAEYAQAYQNARISLVRSAANDVAQRVWETAAMGCVVLKDANSDDKALGLYSFENCLIYQDANEAVGMVRWVLDHEHEAQQIADAGRAWAQSGTWDERAKVIVNWAEAQRKPTKRGKARD
jgi:hypothetical protein